MEEVKEQKQSTSDPESGWFHKGEHKEVFAYAIEAACDENGWILDYSTHPGNEHDSRTFPYLYEKLKKYDIKTMVMDAGYKIPAIAKLLMDDGITPLYPYKRPMTKKGFFRKHEYVYDEYYDCYLCPADQILRYSTTNRAGMKELYGKRKETIERDFGTAKEHHAMRYTQLIGKEKMSMKVVLTFACMNMKKLVIYWRDGIKQIAWVDYLILYQFF